MLVFKIKCVCGYEFEISSDQEHMPDSAIDKLVSIVEQTQRDHLDCVRVARSSPENKGVYCEACKCVLELGCVNKKCNAFICRG